MAHRLCCMSRCSGTQTLRNLTFTFAYGSCCQPLRVVPGTPLCRFCQIGPLLHATHIAFALYTLRNLAALCHLDHAFVWLSQTASDGSLLLLSGFPNIEFIRTFRNISMEGGHCFADILQCIRAAKTSFQVLS
jgi:hypothetical protein